MVAVPAAALIVAAAARAPAPAARRTGVWVWLFSAALAFVDGRLGPVRGRRLRVAGMAASFLLGNLRDELQARLGAAIVLTGAVIIVYQNPNRQPGDYVFLPILSGSCGSPASRCASAPPGPRRGGGRGASRVAEERSRIAAEMHDVVAHSVSVMVLQVGAVRTGSTAPSSRSRGADRVRAHRPRGAREMRHVLAVTREDGDDAELSPQPGLGNLDTMLQDVRRAGLPVRLQVDGTRSSCRARSTCRVPDSSREG